MKAVIYLTRDGGKSVLNAKPFKASITHTPSTNKLSVKCKALFKNNVKLASPEFSTKTQNGYILYFNPDTMEQTTFNLEQDRETFEKVVEVNELLKATKYNTEKFGHPKATDLVTKTYAAIILMLIVLTIIIAIVANDVFSPASLAGMKNISAAMQASSASNYHAAILINATLRKLIALHLINAT